MPQKKAIISSQEKTTKTRQKRAHNTSLQQRKAKKKQTGVTNQQELHTRKNSLKKKHSTRYRFQNFIKKLKKWRRLVNRRIACWKRFQRRIIARLSCTRKRILSFSKKTSRAVAHLNFAKKINAFGRRYFSARLRAIYLSILATIAILAGAWWIYINIFFDLPNPNELTERQQILTTRILDRNGNLLFRIYEDENRTIVPLSQISQHLINATIAIEDKEYYEHQGFSPRGILRAIKANLSGERLEGGSTITQQLVKNRLLDSRRTFQRKIRELILAVLVESVYTKEEILQMYLNQVPYGGSTYGVEEAAWRYFNKPAKELNLAESALLAGLPAAPSVYSPFGPNPELSYRRQEEVLRRMVEDGYISLDEAYFAKQTKLEYRQDVIDIHAPHFVMYVKKLLAEKFGEEKLNQGGLEVRTSLDLSLQQKAQEVVTTEVDKVKRLHINNGAALITNPQTGEILAMVGSRDYFNFENDGQVNVALRPRQPGSSIKPLVYALAFESGKKPWDTIEDSPITYQIPGSTPYSPKNYDGRFRGRVTLRQALAGSLNVPAVKTLAGVGVMKMVEKGEEMGITTWSDSSRFGLSLALGAGEVLMTDLATLYGTFANGGYTIPLDPFIEIRDHDGTLLYRNACFDDPASCRQFQTVSSLVSWQITDILSDNVARAPTFGSYSLLHIPNQQVAVKTGTTNSMRDNWTIGYTTDRLAVSWVGNNDNSPMSFVASGVTGASPIWNILMRSLLDDSSPHRFASPTGLVRVKICATTKTLPCPECPLIIEEYFAEGEQPTQACSAKNFSKKDSLVTPMSGDRGRVL